MNREQIAKIIDDTYNCTNGAEVTNCTEVADAILAAIVEGVPELVWEKLSENCYRHMINETYNIRVQTYGGSWSVLWSAPGICDEIIPGDFDTATAAKTAYAMHHKAQALKAVGMGG